MPHVSDRFLDMCSSFLQELEFSKNPEVATDAYQSANLEFTHKSGFILRFVFIPLDGKYAHVLCGRQWNHEGDATHLSGRYCDLANRLGYSLPKMYSLDGPEKTNQSLLAIANDLTDSLPAVLTRMTVEDIEAIEREPYGAGSVMQFAMRRQPEQVVQVSKIEFST